MAVSSQEVSIARSREFFTAKNAESAEEEWIQKQSHLLLLGVLCVLRG
jgi:hypothetical protein